MCLAIPMQVTQVDGFNALCTAKGVQREVSLFLLQDEDVQVGDYVLIHVGYAIQKISEQDAQTAWELFDRMYEQEAAGA
ncbi:HypC/HybG/HupF family hydrogenase formation chaperone [Methylomonas sp. MgM2]